jgi:glycosyltransferase involved in cell wall biosynthesis
VKHWTHAVKAEIIFFVPEWPALDSPILHAQVLSVASFLNQEGFSCRFAGAETSPPRAREAAAMIAREYNVQAYIHPTLSPNGRAWDYWCSCWRAYGHLRSKLADTDITHIYARSFIGSMWARKLARRLNAISIFDVRGLVGQEKQLASGSSMKSWLISYLELQQGSRADRLATVSENLKQYLGRKIRRHNMTVIPSCFNETSFYFDSTARSEIRKSLDLDETSILLCYSGGMSAWQRIGDIISLLKGVCSADARCKALFLTTSHDEVTRRLKEAQFPPGKAFVRGCSHKEVHRYLSAADVGFIMRHDTLVNNVASPVKVGEYLACGLPVILTRGIGDYSDLLPAAGVGMLLDETADIADQVLRFIHRSNFVSLRSDAIRFAKSRLTMSANLDHYRLLYALKQSDAPSRC